MLVSSFYYSTSDACGIAIFNRHLRETLSRHGVTMLETNLRTACSVIRTPVEILHYVPSSFSSPEASDALVRLLLSRRQSHRLIVILHGLYSYAEHRFRNDTLCPNGEQHIRLMLQTAESITALSDSAAKACCTWRTRFGGRAQLSRLDHPGLFCPPSDTGATSGTYALLGGISRLKKFHNAAPILTLMDGCWRQRLRVWVHWTNVPRSAQTPLAWKRTSGLLDDIRWGELISHAQVVLCPYHTRVQAVSGLISEALSAGRFVLCTSFDLALEMRKRYPTLVFIEDNLQRWPHIIGTLPHTSRCITTAVPTWDSFAGSMAVELLAGATDLTGPEGRRHPLMEGESRTAEIQTVASSQAGEGQMRRTDRTAHLSLHEMSPVRQSAVGACETCEHTHLVAGPASDACGSC
jgi:hypothetical protein